MESKTFKEIREQFPAKFLVLVDPKEKKVGATSIEIIGAESVRAFESGEEMFAAYKDLRKQGLNVRFCPPQYRDSFIIEQIPTLGIFRS